MIQPGQIYRHYKGKEYKIIALAKLEATLEDVIVYEGLYDDPEFGSHPVWIRPMNSFQEHVMITGENNTTKNIPRFSLIQ